jgi:RHS repeat-associated protein
MTLPNGIAAAYEYDAAGNITSMDYKTPGGASVGNLSYAYDASGLRTSVGGSLAPSNLDAATSQANRFDANARQTAANGATITYDADGNVTSDGTRTFSWNGRGQLTKVSVGDSVVTSYTYDALGRRTTVTAGTDTTSFDYDNIDVVAERKGGDPAPVLTGLGTDERYARGKAGQRSYLLTDAMGSTVATTGQAVSITQRYDYAAYGARVDAPIGDNAFQYAGREADSSGLVYMRARYYSPALGRFVSEDPIQERGGLNSYVYVDGNPISKRDPLGLWSWSFEAYLGFGGAIIIGQDPTTGDWFYGGRLGVGASVGGSLDIAGKRPGAGQDGNDCGHGTTAGVFNQLTGTAGVWGGNILAADAGLRLDGSGKGYQDDMAPSDHLQNNRWGFDIGWSTGLEFVGH